MWEEGILTGMGGNIEGRVAGAKENMESQFLMLNFVIDRGDRQQALILRHTRAH